MCRGAAWQPLAVTEAYMGLDPQVFNSEVRRRALEWRLQQEEDFRTKASASIKERVQAETQAYLTRMGIMDTKNPVLRNLKVAGVQIMLTLSKNYVGLIFRFVCFTVLECKHTDTTLAQHDVDMGWWPHGHGCHDG